MIEEIIKKFNYLVYYNGELYSSHYFSTNSNMLLPIKNDLFCSLGNHLNAYFLSQNYYKDRNTFVEKALVPVVTNQIKTIDSKNNLIKNKILPSRVAIIGEKVFSVLTPNKNDRAYDDVFTIDNIDYYPRKKLLTNSLKTEPLKAITTPKYSFLNSGASVIITEKVGKFNLDYNKERYQFGPCNIYVKLDFRRNEVVLNVPTTDRGFHHPFVFDEGRICFNHEARWDRLGVHFKNQPYSWKVLSDVLTCFHEAKSNLIRGYQNNISPVKNLNKIAFKDNYVGVLP